MNSICPRFRTAGCYSGMTEWAAERGGRALGMHTCVHTHEHIPTACCDGDQRAEEDGGSELTRGPTRAHVNVFSPTGPPITPSMGSIHVGTPAGGQPEAPSEASEHWAVDQKDKAYGLVCKSPYETSGPVSPLPASSSKISTHRHTHTQVCACAHPHADTCTHTATHIILVYLLRHTFTGSCFLYILIYLMQGLANFFCKGPAINIFTGHTASVTTTRLCSGSASTALDDVHSCQKSIT